MKAQTLKNPAIRLVSLFCLASGLGFAGTWSGNLVDAKCYQALASNHNLSDSPVLQDVGMEVRYCTPKASTKVFAIVRRDDVSVRLDSAGNAKAAELVQQAHPKAPLYVVVSGEMHAHAIAVSSISPGE
jgi:hypothetical protein